MPDDGPVTLPRAARPASSTGRLIAVSLVALALVIRLSPVFVAGEGWRPAGSEGRHWVENPQMMPAYQLLSAAADWSGLQMRGLVVLQALAGTGVLVLALLMGLRLAGLWAGIVAAALLVFDPLQVIACNSLSPQVMIGIAIAAMAAAGLKFVTAEESGAQRSWRWAALAGAALAAAVYFDWIVLGLVVVTGLVALVAAVVKRRWRLLGGWAIGAAVVAACLAPWVVRNAVVRGQPGLVTSVGLELLCGFPPERDTPEEAALIEALKQGPHDEVGRDRLRFSLAMDRIREHPGQWLGRMAGHTADMWAPVVPGAGRLTMPAAAGYVSLVPAALLALVGLWVLRRRPAVLVWLLMVPVGLTLSHMAFAAGPPDRIAAMPLVAVLGGVGLSSFLHR